MACGVGCCGGHLRSLCTIVQAPAKLLRSSTSYLTSASADETLLDRVIAGVREVYDPEIPLNIYDLGLIYRVDIDEESQVKIDMPLTSPMCPVAGSYVT